MKNHQKQEPFMLTTPEEQLRQLSFETSNIKLSFESPKMTKVPNQKFTIESWNISQELKPNNNKTDRYKDSISTNITSKWSKKYFRAQSAFSKVTEKVDFHNFKSRIKRKSNFFISTFSENFPQQVLTIPSRHQSNQKNENKNQKHQTKKSIYTSRFLVKQRQERMKTFQTYIINQKQKIHRQKSMLQNARTGRQKITIIEYPIKYFHKNKKLYGQKNYLTLRKNKKQKTGQTKNQKEKNISSTNIKNHSKKIDAAQIYSKNYKKNSPFKRFQYFLQTLHVY